MTSSGLNGGPLKGEGEYPAYIACCLLGKKGLPELFTKKNKPFPYLTQDGEDREDNSNQHIAHMLDGATAGYKYFEFETIKHISVKTRRSASGKLIFSHELKGEPIGEVTVSQSFDWADFLGNINITKGKKAPSQSALSRFFSKDFDWLACSIKRLKLFCAQQETSISEGDIVALDDTKIEHPYGKKMPFLLYRKV